MQTNRQGGWQCRHSRHEGEPDGQCPGGVAGVPARQQRGRELGEGWPQWTDAYQHMPAHACACTTGLCPVQQGPVPLCSGFVPGSSGQQMGSREGHRGAQNALAAASHVLQPREEAADEVSATQPQTQTTWRALMPPGMHRTSWADDGGGRTHKGWQRAEGTVAEGTRAGAHRKHGKVLVHAHKGRGLDVGGGGGGGGQVARQPRAPQDLGQHLQSPVVGGRQAGRRGESQSTGRLVHVSAALSGQEHATREGQGGASRAR